MQLTELFLSYNNLVGTIPSSLGNLSSLKMLSFQQNHLEESIPYSLGRLSGLTWLSLSLNNLSGEIPHSLYNLSNIQLFDTGENKLFGSIPSNINLAFPHLEKHAIGNNQISRAFPSSLSNLTELQLFDIPYNNFNGSIPLTLGQLNKLEWFNIGGNNFASGGAHDLDILSSLTNCTQLSIIYLFDSNFGSVSPSLIGNFSIHLRLLHMEYNQIYGVIPERIGQLIGLTVLNIANNSLDGTIPYSIGNLKNLGELYLEYNKFSGNIPIILSFSSNKLSGDIPNQTFGYLDGLIYIDLANNSLTGPIPSEFGNLKHLSALYLNLNKLSGEIPKYLASCLDLTELWLGINFFYGAIPLFLGSSLRSLEVLDLSVNNFSSIIPIELENLTFLNNLNLSFNNLYGEVPTRGVFGNVSAISLTGNKNLCGGIPRLELPPFLKVPAKKHKRSLKKKLILISVTSSSPFLINGSLRVTYGFSSSNLVGRGGFGSVYKGSLLYFERPIVVKVLNLETPGAVKSFVVECKALGNMKHRNLVKILTCCSSVDYKGEDFKAIVFEFMPNGSLENLLHGNKEHESRNLNLNFTQRLDIVLNVAHALDYLHIDAEQVVVHSGVKPSNVLLDDDNVAHLGDFGLARLIRGATEHSSKDQVISSTIKGTIGYVPPGKVLFITYLFLSFKMFYILMPYLYISY
ncbi:putative protein kinase RLK-Pelle-LRR-XII-1 family [Medicago truncatula]|uniref:Protein kinase domain-containing protein n=1 Tax=Medicago truncatula TaxID=3880 RepID=A0A396JL47_MEDTR|nr:putative protein kinase RLK-Pelle-LRR-XII-1 family [Medicago truncatula]